MVRAALRPGPGTADRSPVAGSKPSTSVCGKRPRSRSIAWTGRESSVRVARTQACSCTEAGIGEQLLERAADPGQRAGTGASTNSQEVRPSRPSSTSQEPLRCVASENEYASGDPL